MLRAQLEMSQVRQEMDWRIQEKIVFDFVFLLFVFAVVFVFGAAGEAGDRPKDRREGR